MQREGENMEKPIIKILDTSVFCDENAFCHAYQRVSEERQKKVMRYRFQKDKNLSLGAGVLLSEGLENLGIKKYSVRYGENGKPYLAEYDNVFFSLSHSGVYAAIAFYHAEIGMDIQKISEASEALIKKIATDSEYNDLMHLDAENKKIQFTRLWTIKESYIKYLGTGLSLAPQRLEITFGDTPTIKKDGRMVPVKLEEHDIAGYKIAVCYASASEIQLKRD